MLPALGWIAILMLLALWSLTVWTLHAVSAWAVVNAGALSGAATGMQGLELPAWLSLWMPPEIAQAALALMKGLAPLVDSLLQAAPALAGAVTVLAWGVWGLGSVALVLLGVGLHVGLGVWRRGGLRKAYS